MTAAASPNIHADLARLDEEAQQAGCALACAHQSAEELHSDLIQRYFALQPRWRLRGLATGAAALVVFLLLL